MKADLTDGIFETLPTALGDGRTLRAHAFPPVAVGPEPGIHALGPRVVEEVGDGVWNIVYYTTLLGRIDDRTGLITGA